MFKQTRMRLLKLASVFILAVSIMAIMPMSAFAGSGENRYCEDVPNERNLIMPMGGEDAGSSYNDNQTIYYDYRVVVDENYVSTAPNYGNTDNTMTEVCAPMAGTNAVVFYDRFFPNLIPNFEPGLMNGGSYTYYPDVGWPETEALVRNLYTLMKTNVNGPGTSQAEFTTGLNAYVNQKGYNISYASIKQDSKNVNLSALNNAVNSNKVGILFCSTYNFIYGITENSSKNRTTITKRNSNVGHMMMVYGYEKVAYYKNGVNFRTDTYLQVSSGYSTNDQGFILMNEFLTLVDAQIITIS